MTESSVSFSITTDKNGKMKILYDGSNKKSANEGIEMIGGSPSPCPSLKSMDTTKDSEILPIGTRRRAPSISSASTFTSGSLFERTSTPIPFDDSESVSDVSDVSFASCVSDFSEMSIVTNSSQETVKEERTQPKRPISYEQKNKERYGYVTDGEENWRTVMKKPQEIKYTPPNNNRPRNYSNSSSGNRENRGAIHGSGSSSHQKSRIPSLMDRPVSRPTPSRPLPSNRVNSNIGSYASAASSRHSGLSPASSPAQHFPIPAADQTVKMTLSTDSDGKMRINFSNSKSSESWALCGMLDDSDAVQVRKISDSNNNL